MKYEPSNKPIFHELILDKKITLLVLKGLSDEIKNRILKFDFDKLTFGDGDWSDLSFLKDHKDKIKSLEIGSQNCDWELISDLCNLEELTIGGWFKTNISFKNFSHLKYLSTYWNEGKGYINDLYLLPSLEKLIITGANTITCNQFSTLKNLKYLEIVDSYKLETCNGLEELENLEEIRLYGMRKLENIESLGLVNSLRLVSLEACGNLLSLDGLDKSLSIQELYIERCRKIQSFDFLHGNICKTLSILSLVDVKIESLHILQNLTKLESLSLVGSKVIDGDLSILLKLKKLKSVGLKNSRNFHPSAKEIISYFKKKKDNSFPELLHK